MSFASSLFISFIMTVCTAAREGPSLGMGFQELGHLWEDLCEHVLYPFWDSDLWKKKAYCLALDFAVMMQVLPISLLTYVNTISILGMTLILD